MAFNMKPYAERTPDTQYRDRLRLILEQGEQVATKQETDAITLIAPPPLRFDLSNGFPLITERNMAPKISERLPVTIWQQAIGEICAFINGAHTLDQMAEFGCYWWKDFLTEKKCAKRGLATGDNGPGSYGAAFHDFPTTHPLSAGPGSFNQFAAVLHELKRNRNLRTALVSPWIPYYIPRYDQGEPQKVVVAPCHGWVHLRILNGKLTLHMFQRSADMPIGVPSNICQYAALTLAIAQVLGVEPGWYIHSFSDAHIYVDQVEAVKTMLEREPRAFPTISLDPSVRNLFDLRHEHFTLTDYHPHPGIASIPVAI